MTDPKPPVDWELIEREYRAGQLSAREIAREHGISEAYLRKKAKQRGWQRDLAEEVRKAVRNEAVRKGVRTELSREPVDDAEIVKTHAGRGARAIEGHLARAERIKALTDKLMGELETYMAGGTPTVQIFITKGDGPSSIIRTLADTAERIAKIERQALGIDDTAGAEAGAVHIYEWLVPTD